MAKKEATASTKPNRRGGAPKGNKNAVGNKGGRPGEYNPKTYPRIAAAMIAVGAPENQVAEVLGVAPCTITRWKSEHIEFRNAFEASEEVIRQALEGTALQRALGMTIKTEKATSSGKKVEILETLPPSERMLEFLLKKRMPDEYGDRNKITLSADEVFLEAMKRMNERQQVRKAEQAKLVGPPRLIDARAT